MWNTVLKSFRHGIYFFSIKSLKIVLTKCTVSLTLDSFKVISQTVFCDLINVLHQADFETAYSNSELTTKLNRLHVCNTACYYK